MQISTASGVFHWWWNEIICRYICEARMNVRRDKARARAHTHTHTHTHTKNKQNHTTETIYAKWWRLTTKTAYRTMPQSRKTSTILGLPFCNENAPRCLDVEFVLSWTVIPRLLRGLRDRHAEPRVRCFQGKRTKKGKCVRTMRSSFITIG